MTIGAYSLCYLDGAWLAENIRRLYRRVDAFSIVIGPSERAYGYIQPPDNESEAILRSLPDPQGKITIHAREGWDHKNAMTAVATAALDTDFVMQLDADEFWPEQVFDAAINALRDGAARVFAPHLIFWGGPEHILVHRERGRYYFTPPRFFRRVPGAELGHFDGFYYQADGAIAPLNGFEICTSAPIWHFGWVGVERVARKFRFYREGRKLDMPAETEMRAWLDSGRPSITLALGPNIVDARRWNGEMDSGLAAWVRAMAS